MSACIREDGAYPLRAKAGRGNLRRQPGVGRTAERRRARISAVRRKTIVAPKAASELSQPGERDACRTPTTMARALSPGIPAFPLSQRLPTGGRPITPTHPIGVLKKSVSITCFRYGHAIWQMALIVIQVSLLLC